MRPLAEIERQLWRCDEVAGPQERAVALLWLCEEVLEHWIVARGDTPTHELREGFRLLALHRQGARGDPGFNACRETCREMAWHYNLVTRGEERHELENRLNMMNMIARHLYLFVSGKLEVDELGEFCCSARPVRHASDVERPVIEEA